MTRRSLPPSGAFFILAAATLWGTTGTAQALAPEGAQSSVIGVLRIGIAGLVLLAYLIWRGTWREVFRLPWKRTLLSAVCMAAYQVLFFAGVARTGVAVGTIVGIGSCPIAAGFLGALVLKERLRWRWGFLHPAGSGGLHPAHV